MRSKCSSTILSSKLRRVMVVDCVSVKVEPTLAFGKYRYLCAVGYRPTCLLCKYSSTALVPCWNSLPVL